MRSPGTTRSRTSASRSSCADLAAVRAPGRTHGSAGSTARPADARKCTTADPGIRPAGWRWRWDLNPRWACPHTRFRGVLLRPLGHATAGQATGPDRAWSRPADDSALVVGEERPASSAPTRRPARRPTTSGRWLSRRSRTTSHSDADGAGLVVVRPEDDPLDPREDRGAGAHRARLERDDERAARRAATRRRPARAARSATTSAWPVGSCVGLAHVAAAADHGAGRRRARRRRSGRRRSPRAARASARASRIGSRHGRRQTVIDVTRRSGRPTRRRTARRSRAAGDVGEHLVGVEVVVVEQHAHVHRVHARGRRAGRGRRRAACVVVVLGERQAEKLERRRASSHSSAAVTSESRTRVVGPATRTITKKSSSTATRPTAPPSPGKRRSAWRASRRLDGAVEAMLLHRPDAVLAEGGEREVDARRAGRPWRIPSTRAPPSHPASQIDRRGGQP